MAEYMTGLREVEHNLNEAIDEIKGDVSEGIQDVGLDLLRRSVKLAPVRTGDLRGSGYVDFEGQEIAKGTDSGGVIQKPKIKKSLGNPSAEVGFGVPYAAKQHEEVGYNHPRGGQAKYLEEPMKKNTSRYVELIREKAKV